MAELDISPDVSLEPMSVCGVDLQPPPGTAVTEQEERKSDAGMSDDAFDNLLGIVNKMHYFLVFKHVNHRMTYN